MQDDDARFHVERGLEYHWLPGLIQHRETMPLTRQITAVLTLTLAVLASTAKAQSPGWVPDQLCVQLRADIPDAQQRRILDSFGLRVRLHYPLLQAFWVDTPPGADLLALASGLQEDPRFVFAHPNWYGVRHGGPLFPNDPEFVNQYGLHNTGQSIAGQAGTTDADVDAPEAWSIRTDATDALIAVVDTGLHLLHPDIIENVWQNPVEPLDGIDNDGNGLVDDRYGWDFAANDNIPDDTNGHGTWVTGVLAARGGNGLGVTGVCWTARIMTLRDGFAAPQAALSAAAIEYAAAHSADVINFSSGYPAAAAGILGAAFDTAETAGCVVVVSAGNGGSNIEGGTLNVPAEFTNPNILVVAASDNQDQPSTFTDYGPVSVDVAAAGTQVRTTGLGASYLYVDGTSFSAPLAAGCVALVRAHDRGLSATGAINAVMSTCDVIPAWAGLTVSGGRVNLHDALAALTPSPHLRLRLEDLGAGTGRLTILGASPGASLLTPISPNPIFPAGTGPLLGLPVDALTSLLLPVEPFYATADGNGAYSYTSSGLLPGLAIQARAAEFDPLLGILQLSPIATLLF